jgi:hypothetical protein
MKLKETTTDHRLFAGMLAVIVFFVGIFNLGEIHSKAEQICQGDFGQELTMLYFYIFLATMGCALGVLHLLAAFKFRKPR